MFINRAVLWLLLAVPGLSQSTGDANQMRLHIPVWDINDIYSRISDAFGGSHNKQPVRKTIVNAAAIDDYYNDYWENYYYNNPPYVPQPPPQHPRPTRRPRPTRTTRRPTIRTTTASTTTTSSTTPSTTSTTSTTTTTTTTTVAPTTTTTATTTIPTNATIPPVGVELDYNDYDYSLPEISLKPEQQLSIKSPPHSVGSLCYHHPKLCDQPDKAQFMELTDGNGNPLILIAPAKIDNRRRLSNYKPTRRPFNQRIRPKANKSIFKNDMGTNLNLIRKNYSNTYGKSMQSVKRNHSNTKRKTLSARNRYNI